MIRDSSRETLIRAVEILSQDDVVAFPTETVYGLGANALRGGAITRIYAVKGRPSSNPCIIHVPSFGDIAAVADTTKSEEKLHRLKHLIPGPLTLVLPKRMCVPPEAVAGGSTVGVRVPAHPVAQELLRMTGFPLAAPSANRSGEVSPTSAQHVLQSLGDSVPLIIDGGLCSAGIESTVLSLCGERPVILRPGSVTREVIEAALDEAVDSHGVDAIHGVPLPSPGLLHSHYAPATRVLLWSEGEELPNLPYIWVSIAPRPMPSSSCAAQLPLSSDGNLEVVARNLFSTLRQADTYQASFIVIERCDPSGIGEAILDRLTRAAAPRPNRSEEA